MKGSWNVCSVRLCADRYPDREAVMDPHRHPPIQMTYRELEETIANLAFALRSFGLQSGESVGLFSENSPRWIVADQATMMNGAIDAVRGASAPAEELRQIILNAECVGLIVQDASVLRSLLQTTTANNAPTNGTSHSGKRSTEDAMSGIRFAVVLLDDHLEAVDLSFPVYTYDQAISIGHRLRTEDAHPFPLVGADDVATIVYTSGTSGIPKGVQLTHKNILYQLQTYKAILPLYPGNQILSLLPPWHIYERAVGYYVLSCGCQVVYTDVKRLKSDLMEYPTDLFATVPLVLEALHDRVLSTMRGASLVRRLLGMSLLKASLIYVAHQRVLNGVDLQFACRPPNVWEFLKAVIISWMVYPLHLLAHLLVHRRIKASLGMKGVVISGGGSLSGHLDLFFEAIGIPVLNGWGLTETSPVLCCRSPTTNGNIRGSVGLPIPGTEIKIVDPDNFKEQPDGVPGLLLARGPGVMNGYRNNPEETARVLLPDGWFDTGTVLYKLASATFYAGDRGWRAPEGVPRSHMAGHIVLVGRMKDTIVLSSGENVEPQPIEDWLRMSPLIHHIMVIGQDRRSLGALVYPNPEIFKEHDVVTIRDQIQQEIWKLERQNPGFVQHMHIVAVEILSSPFSIDEGTLTRTMKIRREVILKHYDKEVVRLNTRLR